MKVLFDTNILIALEKPGEILPEPLAEMVRLARELKYEICVHPAQVEDLKRDKDETRREVRLSRLRQYPELDDPPVPTRAGLELLGWSEANDNDRIDNLLSIIPVAAYGGLYYYNVILAGNWDDHYHLNEFVPFFVSILILFVLVYLIGWGIRLLYNRLLARRDKVLKRIWDDDGLDPVTIRIEIYSLGVHAGLYEEKDSVSIPFDILEEVSDKFGIKLAELSKAYMKGALDGLEGKETGNTNI